MRIELNLLNRIEFVRLRIELNAHHNWCVVMMSLDTSKILDYFRRFLDYALISLIA